MAEVPQVAEVADRPVSTITTDPHLPETAEVAERPVSTITADTHFPDRMAETAEVAERPVSTITADTHFPVIEAAEVAERPVSTITTDPHLPVTAGVAERPISTITTDHLPVIMAENAEVSELPVSTIAAYPHLPVRMLGTAEVPERPVSTISTSDTLYAVANIPLPSNSDYDLREPRAPYIATSSSPLVVSDSPRDSSYLNPTLNGSGALLAPKIPETYAEDTITTSPKSTRRSLIRIGLLLMLALVLIILVVILPVYFTVIKPRSNVAKSNSPGSQPSPTSGAIPSSGPTPAPGSPNAITGGDGSTIHAADGSTFIYNNPFGGFCKCFTFFFFFAQLDTVEARSGPCFECY